MKGTKEFETAYNLNYSILKLREAVNHVRHPAIWPSESAKAIKFAREKYPDKSDSELEKDTHGYVYEMRWEQISKASTEMESHLLAAEVLWGKDVLDLTKPLDKKISELNISLKKTFRHIPEKSTEDYTKREEVIYGGLDSEEDNHYNKELNLVISKIEEYIKKKIS
ncbi:MAG: hypothetical protein RLZZ76_329 [Candidatus Parcubacteria bacterium]